MRTFPCCGFRLPDGVIELTAEASKLHRDYHDAELAATANAAPEPIVNPASRDDILILQLQIDRLTAALILDGLDIPTTPGAQAYIARHKLTGAPR